MKNFYICIIALSLFTLQLKAQAPNSLNYQGVARNSSGTVLTNQNISLRFTIHQTTANGTVVYQETQSTTTNPLGLFAVAVGSGTVVSGTFSAIAWGVNTEYLQVEMDPTGGNSYLNMGTSQFLSVPYALNSGTSSTAWNFTGNTGITNPAAPANYGISTFGASENWLGTTDSKDLTFGTDNIERMRIGGGTVATAGNIGIGKSSPTQALDVAGNVQFSKALMPNGLSGTAGNLLLSGGAAAAPTWLANGGTLGMVLTTTTAGAAPTWAAPVTSGSAWQLAGNATAGYAFSATPTTYLGTTASGGSGFQFGVLGSSAGQIESGFNQMTSFGYQAQNNATGQYNTSFGFIAGRSISSGTNNVALGYYALAHESTATPGSGTLTGSYNTAVGDVALTWANLGSSSNTAVGYEALANSGISTATNNNTAVGYQSQFTNSSGSPNTSLGYGTLQLNTIGTDNVALGYEALYNDNSATAGQSSYNTAVGDNALITNTTGTNNTALGYNANVGANNLTNATAIGNGATVSASNTVVLGNNNVIALDFNGALAPYYSGAYQTGTSGQVLTSAGAGTPTWQAPTGSIGTAGAVNYGTGTGSAYTTAGASGMVLQSTGSGAPIWVNISSLGATGGDNWGNQVAVTDSVSTSGATNTINGNGAPLHPLTIAKQGATTGQVLGWNGSKWVPTTAATSGWALLGNAGITNPAAPATYGTSTFGSSENWVGTTDAKDLTFGTDKIERMRIGGGTVATAGYVGIGTSAPNALLTLDGTSNSAYAASIEAFTSQDASYPTFELFNFRHQNLAINFDCFFNGTNWTSSVAGASWQIYDNLGQFQINYATSTVNGNIGATGLTSGFTMNSSGNVGIGIGTTAPAQRVEVGGATQTIRDDGLASTSTTFNVAPSAVTDRIMYANTSGDIKSIPTVDNAVLTTGATGIPAWSTAAAAGWALTGNATAAYTFSASPTTYLGSTASGGSGIQLGVLGSNAGRIESGNNQMTAFGYQALNNASNQYNTSFGFIAGRSISSGTYNVALGYYALAHQSTTTAGSGTLTGSNNTAVGDVALTWANFASSNNTAVGFEALANSGQLATGTNNNTAVGYQTQFNNTSGTPNTSIGYQSLYGNSIGTDNVAVGYSALYNNTASQNTAIGDNALTTNTTGTNNTALGYDANVASAALTNATAIGANASVSASNSLVLGGTGANAVSVGIGNTAPNSVLQVSGSIATAVASQTTAYTLTATDAIISANATSGAFTVTLPTAVGIAGRQYTIKKTDVSANAVTVGTTSSQTIDGVTTYSLPAQWKYVTVVSDGSNWMIVANN